MGRFADLCSEVAAAAEEGPGGLVLAAEDWEKLRAEWSDDDIEDALGLVRDSFLQGELVEAADSLSARLLDVLGALGDATGFKQAEAGGARLSLEVIGHLARRIDRLEEILDFFRDGPPPDRTGFDALRRRLANQGIEAELEEEPLEEDDE
jgi:hypothetical protein